MLVEPLVTVKGICKNGGVIAVCILLVLGRVEHLEKSPVCLPIKDLTIKDCILGELNVNIAIM